MSDPDSVDKLGPDWHLTPTSHTADAPEAFLGKVRTLPDSIGDYRILLHCSEKAAWEPCIRPSKRIRSASSL